MKFLAWLFESVGGGNAEFDVPERHHHTVNPANGLPMVNDSIDVAGNPFGTDLHDHGRHDDCIHDFDSSSYDTLSHDTLSHDTWSHDTWSHDTWSHDTWSHDTSSHDWSSPSSMWD